MANKDEWSDRGGLFGRGLLAYGDAPGTYKSGSDRTEQDEAADFVRWALESPSAKQRIDAGDTDFGDWYREKLQKSAALIGASANKEVLRCLGNATFSAVGPLPQASGNSAIFTKEKPKRGTVAIAGQKTFGFDKPALRSGAAKAIKIKPQGLDDILKETGGPLPPFTVGDYGDKNIRNAPGTRYDIYRFPTKRAAKEFGKRTVPTVTEIPSGGHCPPGSVPMKKKSDGR